MLWGVAGTDGHVFVGATTMNAALGEQELLAGREHMRAGRLREAELVYRKILSEQPRHAEALHLLGLIAAQTGHLEAATDLLKQSIENGEATAEAYNNLGNILAGRRNWAEAVAAYRRAIGMDGK